MKYWVTDFFVSKHSSTDPCSKIQILVGVYREKRMSIFSYFRSKTKLKFWLGCSEKKECPIFLNRFSAQFLYSLYFIFLCSIIIWFLTFQGVLLNFYTLLSLLPVFHFNCIQLLSRLISIIRLVTNLLNIFDFWIFRWLLRLCTPFTYFNIHLIFSQRPTCSPSKQRERQIVFRVFFLQGWVVYCGSNQNSGWGHFEAIGKSFPKTRFKLGRRSIWWCICKRCPGLCN